MRKIEQQMIQAIKDGRCWTRGNTHVSQPSSDTFWRVRFVFLHGNAIATIEETGTIRPNLTTFRNWPTRTTVSRLRALGINASVKKGVAMIDGEPV